MMVLRLHLFGAFQAQIAEEGTQPAAPLSFPSDKVRALLAYLAVENGRPHSRDALAALLWPEYPNSDALHNLRNSLYRLRKEFGSDLSDKILTVDRQSAHLQAANVWLDVAQFKQLLDDCAGHQHHARRNCFECIGRLQKAADLYQGEFLAGFSLPDALPFDEWLLVHRERFHQQSLADLYDLSAFCGQQGQYGLARKYAARQIALEPWREAGHRQMMRALALSGRLDDALVQFENCCRILAQELDTEPAPETILLYEQIRDSQTAGQAFLPPVAEQDDAAAGPAYHLPRQFTQFVGRRAEISAIIERLANPDCALLTITGPGGIGKTRLAIEAARQQIGMHEDGVWFVSLAPVQAVDDIPAAIAASLPLPPFNSGDIERQLLNYLSSKQALLIIDNFEHLLAGADFLLTLLQQAPRVKILTTSRERLNLQAAWVFDIQGLTTPSNEMGDSLLENYAAVQLFIQQLQQVRRTLVLTEEDIEEIGRICRLVEGVPLAIELAINLTTTLSFSEIADLIANDLDRLETRSRDVPDRQRSLRAVFDYSWNLLQEGEQKALKSLAIFPASFTTKAVVEITGTAEPILRVLIEKSFLRRDENDRFEMHVLLRQFAGEKLYETADNQAVERLRARHSAYYMTYLLNHDAEMSGSKARPALKKVQQEIDNIRLAWNSAVALPDLSAIAQSAPALVSFFSLVGQPREGERLLKMAIKAIGGSAPQINHSQILSPAEKKYHRLISYLLTQRVRFLIKLSMVAEATTAIKQAIKHGHLSEDDDVLLEALNYWGIILWRQGHYEQSKEQLDKAFEVGRRATADIHKIRTLVQLGNVHTFIGDFVRARQYYEQAIHDYEAAGVKDLSHIAVYSNLGLLCVSEGKYAEAKRRFQKALDLYIQIGSLSGRGTVLAGISDLAFQEQNYGKALSMGRQALDIFQEIGEVVREGGIRLVLGNVFARLGQWETAQNHFEQALDLTRQIHNQNSEGEALVHLAFLACQLGDFQEALRLSEQALPLAEKSADRDLHAYALTGQGRALAGIGRMEEAVVFYSESLALRQELKQWYLIAEIEALLAHIYLDHNDFEQAGDYVERVMGFLQLSDQEDAEERPSLQQNFTNSPLIRQLQGVQDPFCVYLICYQVLQAKGDERGRTILHFAANLLEEQANLLDDDSLKQSFLENVPVNRQISVYNLQFGLEDESLG